jgi:hypothetical protein
VRRLVLATVLSGLLIGGLAPIARAATVNVTDAGGLRTAITNANSTGEDDVINLAAGDYPLSGTGDDTNATGDLDVLDAGKLTLAGAGAGATTISAGPSDRVLDLIDTVVATHVDLVLSGLTVTGGFVAAKGGGIRGPSASHLTLQRVALTDNTSTGMFGEGGGIQLDGPSVLDVSDSTISGNKAGISAGEFGSGGGFSIGLSGGGGTVNVTNSVLSGNESGTANVGRGGAARLGNAVHTTIVNSTIAGNTAGANDNSSGGGFHQEDDGELTLTNSAVTGNTAATVQGGRGGGLFVDSDVVFHLTNVTLSGNRAGAPTATSSADGGGMSYQFGSHGNFDNVTIAGNVTAPGGTGGGIFANLFGGDPLATLKNTIIAGNQAGDQRNCSAPVTSQGHNLEDTTDDCQFTAAGDIQNADPKLGPLQDNGGATQTRALLAGSPAIDKGADCAATDQRGTSRPQGPACDIGAFEAVPSAPAVSPPLAALSVSAAGVSPKTFAVNPKGTVEIPVAAAAKRRVKLGTTFRYTLSRAGRVVFLFERKTNGRRVGKRCRKATKRNRKRRRCTRYVKTAAFAAQGVAGKNKRKFSGRIRRRKLRPGRYRVTLTAIDAAGVKSARKRLSVRIVKAPRKRARRR